MASKGMGGAIKRLCLYISSVHQVFNSETDD